MDVVYRCMDQSCERTRDHWETHARRSEYGGIEVWGDTPLALDVDALRAELEPR